jgi:hypothetical protein
VAVTAPQLNVTLELPAPTTVRPVAAIGVWFGVTEVDAADAAPKPIQFSAATLKTYVVPLVRPDTNCEVVAADEVNVLQVDPLFEENSTRYAVTAQPFAAGATQLTVA